MDLTSCHFQKPSQAVLLCSLLFCSISQAAPQAPLAYRLAVDRECMVCHDIGSGGSQIGPSFQMIAVRYQKDNAALETLTQSVVKGSRGKWGNNYMWPQPIREQDAKTVVHWILQQTPHSKPKGK